MNTDKAWDPVIDICAGLQSHNTKDFKEPSLISTAEVGKRIRSGPRLQYYVFFISEYMYTYIFGYTNIYFCEYPFYYIPCQLKSKAEMENAFT